MKINFLKISLLIIIITLYVNSIIYTNEEIFELRKRICNKLKIFKCSDCKNVKDNNKNKDPADIISLSKFYYGIPFSGKKQFFHANCDCHKVKEMERLCRSLDKVDPLKGLSHLDLNGIIIDNNNYNNINNKTSNLK